jgi:hypothetical protein
MRGGYGCHLPRQQARAGYLEHLLPGQGTIMDKKGPRIDKLMTASKVGAQKEGTSLFSIATRVSQSLLPLICGLGWQVREI